MDLHTGTSTSTRTPVFRRHLLKWFCMAGLGLIAVFAGGCLTEGATGSFTMPIMLLERNEGATHIVLYPSSTEPLEGGAIRYTGTAYAQIQGDPQAGRETAGIDGNAVAVVNEASGERQFTFTSASSTDLGWSGLASSQLTIEGSGPPSAGAADLVAAASLDGSRSSGWGFQTSDVGVSANLAASSPIFVVSAETGSVGNPAAVVQAPNPGGLSLDAQAMGLIFAPVAGETTLGQVDQGAWVKFVLPGSIPLSDGATLSWDPSAGTLGGGGAVGGLPVPGATIDATIELTATSSASYLSFSGPMDPPQLDILHNGTGLFWTDGTCTDCADLRFTGNGLSIDTINIPSLEGNLQIRDGVPTSSVISASGVNGSIGPVVIDDGTLAVDMSDFENLTADLAISGSVLGMPVTTTFSGPFSFDIAQMGINLDGDLYLNVSDQVILDGQLNAAIGLAGADVTYTGDVRLPGYGAAFDVTGNVVYDITQQSLGLSVQASGAFGPVSVQGVDFQLGLAPAASGGMDVSGSLDVDSIAAGTASLTNVRIGLSGNTSSTVTATINDASNRAHLAVGTLAQVDAHGSVTYNIPTNSLAFGLAFDGRVGSWQVGNGTLSVNWPGSGNVTGALTVGQISNGQVTISNAIVDFTASPSSVSATLRPTSITAGSLLSATVSGNASYNLTTNVMSLSLSASGRVGGWNVTGVSATVNWPGSGNVTGTLTVGQVSNGQVTISNAIVDFTASPSSVSATLRPTSITAGSLLSATVSGTATYNTSTSTMALSLSASGRVGPVNVTGVQATVTWPLSGNITGSVSIGNVSYGPASLNNTTIGFTANTTSVNATIGSTLDVGDPFRLNVGLSGTASYNLSTNTLNVAITTGSGTMWGKPITGSVALNVNVTGSTISGSVSTSSLRLTYDKFGITLANTSLNFSVSGSTVSVSGSGNVSVNGPMGNGWLSGSGGFTVTGNVLRSTNYHITLNNMNKTITWVDVGPRNGAPLTVDILAGSLSYDAEGKMRARVDTGFPLYCEDLEFKIHAWGDQNVLRVDFEGSYVLGLFGARGHMDVNDWLSNTNPPMYGYADARITFFWFRFQTWNGQGLENGGC